MVSFIKEMNERRILPLVYNIFIIFSDQYLIFILNVYTMHLFICRTLLSKAT